MKSERDYGKILKKTAANIKKYRRIAGLTQEDMVGYGFNYRHYQKIESGTYSPNLRTLHRVANAFGISLKDLFLLELNSLNFLN